MALIADDLTVALFQKSVVRKTLRKTGTVTVDEKVERKLVKREQSIGRRARSHESTSPALQMWQCLMCSRNASRRTNSELGCAASFSNRLPSSQSDTPI
jgi:hypothetical protein